MKVQPALHLALLLGLLAPFAHAETPPLRSRALLAAPWRFKLSAQPVEGEKTGHTDSSWSAVTIPHTWAGPDGKPCAVGWYRTTLHVAKSSMNERTCLYFEGVATAINVYLNGEYLGTHRGAFTAAIFDATDSLNANRQDGKHANEGQQ